MNDSPNSPHNYKFDPRNADNFDYDSFIKKSVYQSNLDSESSRKDFDRIVTKQSESTQKGLGARDYGKFPWKGCDDSVEFGELFAKWFVEVPWMKKNRTKKEIANKHNSAVGRKVT